MDTRKLLSVLIGISVTLLLSVNSIPTVYAADNDNVNVTCYGSYLECNIVNLSWDIGTVQMSTSYWTNDTDTLHVETHNSTAGTNIDFEMAISADAADWNRIWPENETTEADGYRLNTTSDAWVSQAGMNISVYADVDDNFAPGDNVTLDMRFDSPTSTTTGAQQTITLNGKVTVH